MATLVLSAVGTVVGGPIGGAIGAIVGQQIDQNILFKPKGREGPRLQELAVQTSSYGSQVPRIFGRMRVAGTVIWATDLKETRSREGGGKGRPSTTIYSYSACFAVALSSRRIRRIGRIWADGKIFRGVAGDFKTETQFAFHPGGEDQPVDGLMASAEGNDGTPAYRGLALAIFEDMDLTEYGNRIPSLTFEVIADDGSVSIAEIIADISSQRIAMPPSDMLIGFAAGGEDRQAALRALTDSIPLSFSSDPSAIAKMGASARNITNAESVLTIAGDFVRAAGKQEIAPPAKHTASIAAAPRQLSVRYYDPARDYQSGIQSAFRPGAGRSSLARDFPATMPADQAKKIAATNLWSEYDQRSTLHVSLPLNSHLYRPATLVEIVGFEGLWRIWECEIAMGFVQLSLRRASPDKASVYVGSEQGRSITDPDLRAGLTRLVLVDLPFAVGAPSAVSDSARLYAAAAGDAGWRNAQLFASGPDGAPGQNIGQIPAPTVIGTTAGTLDSANPALIDQVSHIDVVLQNPAMHLVHADDAQLLAGSNIALIGKEIIQFAVAAPIGDARFRLSRLIRGLGGTEIAIANHGAEEDFVLLDGGSMLEIGSAFYAPFAPAVVFALGRDDLGPVSAAIASPGRALMPWSPVHPRWNFVDGGDLEIRWTRRSRAGTIWSDHVEVPLAEEVEKYRVELAVADGSVASVSLESPEESVIISAAQIQAFVTNNINDISVRIFQIGGSGRSAALAFEIPL
ncbi:MAG: phage tail protein [Parasphingorhabdus sp.]